jgi:hypothetical protein
LNVLLVSAEISEKVDGRRKIESSESCISHNAARDRTSLRAMMAAAAARALR